MSPSVVVVGDIDTVIGFKLAGVKGYIVKNDEDAEDAINEIFDEDVSIIIITEKIANNIRGFINKKIGSKLLPMIIEIPSKDGFSDKDNDPMRDLIKQVIGVEVVK